MFASQSKALFWCLFSVQVCCAKIILWLALPAYRNLQEGQKEDSPYVTIIFLSAIVLMQVAYWLAFRLQPRLQFRRNVVVGHFLLCIGELCFVFPTTFAAVALFDRTPD